MIIEYVWLDGEGKTRSKTRVLYEKFDKDNLQLPLWNYDGSSTGQATTGDSEVILKPCSAFPDPFRGGECMIALCETYNRDMSPHKSNTRNHAETIFNKNLALKPMFGFEQEFYLERNGKILAVELEENRPIKEQGEYYCGVGGNNIYQRELIEKAFKNCLLSGLKITGYNAEVAPSQWELQLCATGIEAADQVVIMRYILNRTAELYGLSINFEPKPWKGEDKEWNGSGGHVNFSTKPMREDGGYPHILDAVKRLEKNHSHHMEHYGKNNLDRLNGTCETSKHDVFSFGIADRSASIRIPAGTFVSQKGYLEDRRPGANIDPYKVFSMIFETIST